MNTYTQLLNIIRSSGAEQDCLMSPEFILSEFERSSQIVLRSEFPQSRLHGCYFHFTQAIYNYIQENGLVSYYRDYPEIRRFFRHVMSIGFLPPARVEIFFDNLLENFIGGEYSEEIIAVVVDIGAKFGEYVAGEWLSSQQKTREFNVYGLQQRTNNNMESWHHHVNRSVKKTHPNIFELIQFMQKEQALTESAIVHLDGGDEPPRRRQKYVYIDKNIDELRVRYEEEGIRA